MLQIPEIGFKHSVEVSNVSTNKLADWLEANVLFDEPEISKNSVVDLLLKDQICPDDKKVLAHQIASEGWSELSRRKRWGGLPENVSITSSRIKIDNGWEDDPIWSFFVLLSVLRIYPVWAKDHQDYVVQGNLFEKVVETICPALLPGWASYRVGWSPDNSKNIPEIVEELCSRIFVKGANNLEDWLEQNSKDGGLDIVCYRTFEDEREALPVFFLQCASGKNWRDKVGTPNPILWQKYLDSAVQPSTGIIAPFVIEEKELMIEALKGQIIVFDRLRMLSAVKTGNIQLAAELLEDLIRWLRPRVESLTQAA